MLTVKPKLLEEYTLTRAGRTYSGDRGGRGRGVHANAYLRLPTVDLAPLKCWDGACQVFVGQVAFHKGHTSY